MLTYIVLKLSVNTLHSTVTQALMALRKQYVENCQECAKQSHIPKAPLIPTPLPDYPWQQIGADLF